MKTPQERHEVKRAGLTLIEVLLAAALLSIGLVALLTAASRCLAVMRVAKQYQAAQWTLNLAELEHPMMPTDDEEDWEVDEEEYENGLIYSREVEARSEDEEDGIFVIRSRVTWARRGRQATEEVVRYVFIEDKVER